MQLKLDRSFNKTLYMIRAVLNYHVVKWRHDAVATESKSNRIANYVGRRDEYNLLYGNIFRIYYSILR
jgi:hypothetical protein